MHYGLDLLSREEYEEWVRQIPLNTCPFCEWRKYQYVLHQGGYWLWIACRAPYWKYHTMFIPKRHFQEMNEMTVVEMGELIELYSLAVKRCRESNLELNGKLVKKFLFFWRLRDDPMEERNIRPRMVHFHMHFTPDREGLLDAVLDADACDWDPQKLED
jgi:hypothetical protein